MRGTGGSHTQPFLWADPRLRPPRRRCSLQLWSLLLQWCSASESLLFCARTSKFGERKKRLSKNGCGPFKTCPLPFPFPPYAPSQWLVPKYRGRRGGNELTPSKESKGPRSRRPRKISFLSFPFRGGCDSLQTNIRRKGSVLPSLCVPETKVFSTVHIAFFPAPPRSGLIGSSRPRLREDG